MGSDLITTPQKFAKLLVKILKSDRDGNVGVGGFTGEGKSTVAIIMQKEVSKLTGIPWSFKNNCTWSRREFIYWVNGKPLSGEIKKIKGRLPEKKKEYTSILLDELFSMFYRRNWHHDNQKEAISLLNMCRDRHLFIMGNCPLFWDLDGGFLSRVRYYLFVPTRGVAWIFQQENNPFASDPWNVVQNRKLFRKNKGQPYKLPNFVAELHFPDLTPEEKTAYLQIRNSKRIQAQEDVKKETIETYTSIKQDRDNLIRALHLKHKVSQKDITGYCSLKKTQVSNICLGIR